MADNHIARRNRQGGGASALAVAALAVATLIGIGITQAGGRTAPHPSSTLVRLLTFPNSPGSDAFTFGPLTFDPVTALPVCVSVGLCTGGTEGYSAFPSAVFPGPPLLNISGGSIAGIGLADQDFMVYNSAGTALGYLGTAGTIIKIAGQPSYEFQVTSDNGIGVTPPSADLPPTGTIFDIFNFNLLPSFLIPTITNVYEAVPGGAVDDYVVVNGQAFNIADAVPLGSGAALNLAALLSQNLTGDMNPAAAFSNLVATSGNSSIGSDAFTINVPGFDYTLDPFNSSLAPNSYNAVSPLASFAPVLAAGGANIDVAGLKVPVVSQGFNVYQGTTNVGSFDDTEFVTQFLGQTTTEEVVTSVTPHLGFTDADLPAVGTVFSVTNQTPFGLGEKDTVYLARPGEAATISTVTPSGTVTTPAPFNVDAAGDAEINPSSIFASLVTEQAGQNAGIPTPVAGPDISKFAFTINGLTFGPENSAFAAGYNDLAQTSGGAPLMAVFGGGQVTAAGIPVSLGPQDFFYYTGEGADAKEGGELAASVAVVDLLFFQNASITITGCAVGSICTAPPADGTVFDVLNLGFGVNNLYEGAPDGKVFDEVVTPFGPLFNVKLDLPPSMDAGVPLNPADIVPAGLDVPFT